MVYLPVRPPRRSRLSVTAALGVCLCTLFLFGLAACGSEVDDFNAAQTKGNEALEAFVAQHPNSNLVPIAMVRLDDGHFEAARKANTIEGWKDYLKKHPDSKHVPEANYALEQASYKAAEKAGTREALEQFLTEFPSGTFSPIAKKRRDSLGDIGKIKLEDAVVEADNVVSAKGDKDGWKVSSTIENGTSRPLKRTVVRIHLLGPDGATLATHEVAPVYTTGIFSGADEQGPDEWKVALPPGEKRKFYARFTKVPENWKQQVRLEVGDVDFM